MFLKPEEKFEHLQTYICEQTSVVAESQILLYKEKLLLSEIDDNTLGNYSIIRSVTYYILNRNEAIFSTENESSHSMLAKSI